MQMGCMRDAGERDAGEMQVREMQARSRGDAERLAAHHIAPEQVEMPELEVGPRFHVRQVHLLPEGHHVRESPPIKLSTEMLDGLAQLFHMARSIVSCDTALGRC